MTLAIDTSVAVPLLSADHVSHRAVTAWWDGRPVVLAGHAAVETYAVLTRLPGTARLTPDDAARLLAARFGESLQPSQGTLAAVSRVLADLDVVGGASYDAVVALAARDHGAVLATRDVRALPTYAAVGVQVEVVPSIGDPQ